MCRFAWKTFQKWQQRLERNAKEKKEKRALLEFMCAFRETFSRPVNPIRFLGLFDTVNSVPRFENAWMRRSKFPYTARSSAKVIRHAVSIDERRAKFRQDLISQGKPDRTKHHRGRHHYGHHRRLFDDRDAHVEYGDELTRGRKPSVTQGRRDTLIVPRRYRHQSDSVGVRSRSRSGDGTGVYSATTSISNLSMEAIQHYGDEDSENGEQDIQEVWFAGCHAVSFSVLIPMCSD
jgi:uncharacterized protein (DUF2235 family)